MQAIILVGGQGTRLQSVLPNVPKPMAPIQNQPFLFYLLRYLKKQGIERVLFPVFYHAQQIMDFFGNEFLGMKIQYIQEDEPLGTGGAIVNALTLVSNDKPVFVLNGDTFVKINYQTMLKQHIKARAQFTMALRSVPDCSRYGSVMTQDNVVIEFGEKGNTGPGFINTGVYLLQPALFKQFVLPKIFSIETEFLFPYIEKIRPQAFFTDDYFIDIGIPADYQRACHEVPKATEYE